MSFHLRSDDIVLFIVVFSSRKVVLFCPSVFSSGLSRYMPLTVIINPFFCVIIIIASNVCFSVSVLLISFLCFLLFLSVFYLVRNYTDSVFYKTIMISLFFLSAFSLTVIRSPPNTQKLFSLFFASQLFPSSYVTEITIILRFTVMLFFFTVPPFFVSDLKPFYCFFSIIFFPLHDDKCLVSLV